MDFAYTKSGSIFNMHSYWTKQPVEVIEYFIKTYSSKNNLVLDPFCGTGMTGVAALRLNRNALLNDLSPICCHISKGYTTDFKVDKNICQINHEIDSLFRDIDQLYLTKCVKCQSLTSLRFTIISEIWQSKNKETEEDRGSFILNNQSSDNFNNDFIFKEFRPIKICYSCKCTKEKQYKTPDSNDFENHNNNLFKNYFYPKNLLLGQEPKRNYKRGVKKVYQLYSPRNLSALSLISHRINNVKKTEIRELFLFVFTSILFNSSLLSRYRSYENTSIKMGTFYIPPLIKDTNVINNFKNKLKAIQRGNSEIFKNRLYGKVKIICSDATKIGRLKENSIDYIYTDPPYSDVISYSELNVVYESWLKAQTETNNEMIVSNYQNKDIEYYADKFQRFLNYAYKVLKPNKVLTLIFHHPNIEHWIYLQKAFTNNRFKPIQSTKPLRLVSKSKTSSQHKTKKNTQCFLAFNFKKSNSYKGLKLKKLSDKQFFKLIERLKLEGEKQGYRSKADLYDFLLNQLIFKYEIKGFKL